MTVEPFTPGAIADEDDADRLKHYVRADQLHGRTFNRTWLVENLIEKGRVYEGFGRWKGGKTIAFIDMAAHTATGEPWGDRRTSKAIVVYVAGEAVEDIEMRLAAWQIRHGITAAMPFVIRVRPVYLTEYEFAQTLYQELLAWQQEFGEVDILLVIDTLARNFGSSDENSPQGMGAFVNNLLDVVVHPSKCTCLVVHHSGHGDAERGRGHSSFAGAVDGSIKVSMDKTSGAPIITVATVTSRNTEGSDQLSFRIETQELEGQDNFGNQVSAPVLRYLPDHVAEPPKTQRGLGQRQTKVLDLLMQMHQTHQQKLIDGGLPIDGAQVSLADWRNAAIEKNLCSRTNFYDIKTKLMERGLIQANDLYATPL